jgi:signal transduction histidine kinase
VADTGCGVPEEDLPHLFERFYRADKARGRSEGHFGLGLAIVKAIVEAHQGTIELQSIVGQGTTVTVRFPGNSEQQ